MPGFRLASDLFIFVYMAPNTVQHVVSSPHGMELFHQMLSSSWAFGEGGAALNSRSAKLSNSTANEPSVMLINASQIYHVPGTVPGALHVLIYSLQ